MGNFVTGTGEVQTYQTNRLHNNDVTTVNGRWSDNGMNESQKMTSWTQMDKAQTIQMMSHTR